MIALVEDIHETAARWRLAAEAGGLSPGEEAALAAWLAEAPEHVRAYQAAAAGLEALAANAADPLLAELRAEARGTLRQAARARSRRRVVLGGLGAAAAAATIGVIVAPELPPPQPQIYATPPGPPRTVSLPDGSRVTLDGDTRLIARFTRQARQLELAQGQARFDVAHEAERPLTVAVGDRRVQALGTSFNIDRLASRSVVTLISGRVRIGPADRPAEWEAVLAPGQTFVGPDAGPGRVSQASPATAQAWASGRMVLQDSSLADAVLQLNRRGARLRLTDPSVGRLRLSGVFDANDPDAFVEAVTAYLPVSGRPGPDGVTLLSPRVRSRP